MTEYIKGLTLDELYTLFEKVIEEINKRKVEENDTNANKNI